MKGTVAVFCIAVAAIALPHVLIAQDNSDDMLN